MPVKLTAAALRKAFPRARPGANEALLAKQGVLDAAGVTETRNRLATYLAQMHHESGGLTILVENTNYSAQRMAQVWPNRFSSAAAVQAKYGTALGWQRRAFGDIYGNRMGNRPGTLDGYDYRGRGFIQITGRDGYANVGKRAGLPLEAKPEMAADIGLQPEITTGFWSWKGLNPIADTGNFVGVTKRINGGTNGLADRKAQLARIKPIVDALEGGPATPGKPPKEVVDEATKKERTARNSGAGGAVVGGGNEAAKTGTEQPATPVLPSWAAYTLIGAGVAVAILAVILIARKRSAITKHWF